jgi:phenylpyruvate tautomerase PptA (4-oxalocrotonate tautomerase family)
VGPFVAVIPLWLIYHPPTVFQEEGTKRDLAQKITEVYTIVGLPAFYVNVIYNPVEPSNYYIGGVARPSPHTAANEPGPDSSKPWIRMSVVAYLA